MTSGMATVAVAVVGGAEDAEEDAVDTTTAVVRVIKAGVAVVVGQVDLPDVVSRGHHRLVASHVHRLQSGVHPVHLVDIALHRVGVHLRTTIPHQGGGHCLGVVPRRAQLLVLVPQLLLDVDLVHPLLPLPLQVAVTKAEQVVVLLLVDVVCLIRHLLLQVDRVLLREDTDGAAPVGASLLPGGASVVHQGQERLLHLHVTEAPAGSVAKLVNIALAQVTVCLPGAVQWKWITTRQS